MTEPTEQARNELSAEALAEWCEQRIKQAEKWAQHARTPYTRKVEQRNIKTYRRIAAMLRAGERCYEEARQARATKKRNAALRAWEAAHE